MCLRKFDSIGKCFARILAVVQKSFLRRQRIVKHPLSKTKFLSDLVTFTEEILNGKLRFFVQC